MWQRKQTLYLMAAIIMTVICLCMQIGSFKVEGLEVARLYKLAILLPTAAIATYTIFIYHNRKMQALFCLFNMLLVIGWYVCYFVIAQMVGDKAWGTIDFRPTWPAVFPAISLICYFLARRGILADEKLVRSMDRIR